MSTSTTASPDRPPLEVRITVDFTSAGQLRYVFARCNGAPIGEIVQLTEHRWQAHAAQEQLGVATAHASYTLAEQALLQRAGLGESILQYSEVTP